MAETVAEDLEAKLVGLIVEGKITIADIGGLEAEVIRQMRAFHKQYGDFLIQFEADAAFATKLQSDYQNLLDRLGILAKARVVAILKMVQPQPTSPVDKGPSQAA